MAGDTIRQVFLSYEDAETLKPFFRAAVKRAGHRNERQSASRILRKLDLAREDVDYGPLPGAQILLENKTDEEFLRTVMNTYGL